MEPYVTVDRSQLPIIIVTFTGAIETPENFEQYLQELNRNYDAKEPIGLVFNAQNAHIPSRMYQKRQADWMRANASVIKSYCRGIAYIVPNPFLRPVLQLIFATQKVPSPSRVFSNEKLGLEWLKRQCLMR
jgi:hypothetical protein